MGDKSSIRICDIASVFPTTCAFALGAAFPAMASGDAPSTSAADEETKPISVAVKERAQRSESTIMKAGIPAEFLDLIDPTLNASAGTLIVDVFVDGVNVTSTILEPMNDAYVLTTPEDIAAAIGDLSDSADLLAVTRAPLSETTENLCIVGLEKTCVSPTDHRGSFDNPSMILDVSNLRLDIYLPRRLKSKPPLLAPSHANHTGVISAFRGQVSGRTVNGNTDLSGALSYRVLAGRGRNSAFADGALRSTGELNLRRFGVQRFQGERRYAAGVIQSGGSQLSAQTRIIGIELERIPSLRSKDSSSQVQPIILFLSSRALVTVFRDGEQLYSNFLDAGPQSLDTRLFPSGAYNIEIEITPDGEEPYRESRFFTNTGHAARSINWRFSAGVAQRQRNDQGLLTSDDETENAPTANLTVAGPGPMGSWLSGQLGVNGDFAFAELSSNQVWRSISLNTAGRVSNSGYSANVQAQGRVGPVALSTNARFSQGLARASFDSANSSNRRLLWSTTASAPIGGIQVNGFARVAKVNGQSANTAIGLRASKSLQLGRTNILLSGNVQNTSSSTSAGIRVSVGRQIPNATVRAFANVRGTSRGDDFEIGSRNYGVDSRYRFKNKTLGNPNVSMRVLGDEEGLVSVGSAFTSQTSLLNTRARVQKSLRGDRSTNFTSSIDTSVAVSAAGIGLSAKNSVDGGIMVRQRADSSTEIRASVPGAGRFTVGKRARFIPARSFNSTRVRFRPAPGELVDVKSNSPEILLFPGNIVPVEAEVVVQVSVYGQVVDQNGKTLPNAYLRSGGVDFVSDDSGFFVADLPVEATTVEHIRDGEPVCSFKVALSREDNVKGLGRMVCRSEF